MEPSSDLIRGTIVPVVLALLSEREMYGYEMVKLVNARSNGALQWREGTLYPALHGLERDGLISAAWREAETGKRRKYYKITAKGRRELTARREQWMNVSGAVTRLLMGA